MSRKQFPTTEYLAGEIRRDTKGAKLYNGGPGIDYRTVSNAWAMNATLMRGIDGVGGPTEETELLVVQRGAGEGKLGSWSGVSGFLDRPDLENPLKHAIRNELREEVGVAIGKDFDGFVPRIGEVFSEPRGEKGEIHIVPVALEVVGDTKPEIHPDGTEVTRALWIPLGEIAARGAEISFSPGYRENTLPGALAAYDMDKSEARRLMGFK